MEMDTATPEESPLSTLYLQIEYGDTPSAILGVSTKATETELRDVYRDIVLRIHPDKAPGDDLRELHTSLFQKVNDAYNQLLKRDHGHTGDDDAGYGGPKRLPETLASLHARNTAFREALRRERERALNAKHAVDAQKAAKQASLKAKNERLTEKREMRAQAVEQQRIKREKEMAKEGRKAGRSQAKSAESTGTGWESESAEDDAIAQDWEQEEQRLEKEDRAQAVQAEGSKVPGSAPNSKRPLRNKPTAETARPMWDKALDERLVSDAEIKGRWNQNLLSGGRSGSVSLQQKKQKQHSGAARMQKLTMALSEEADHMLKPALTGNRTFSAMEEEDLMQQGFVGAEGRGEARTNRVLQLMDKDVVEQSYIEDEEHRQGTSLASLAIKEG